jgi:hypothetical protein
VHWKQTLVRLGVTATTEGVVENFFFSFAFFAAATAFFSYAVLSLSSYSIISAPFSLPVISAAC